MQLDSSKVQWALAVVVLVHAAVADADERPMQDARERIMTKAALQAFKQAKALPPITNKAFAAVWRREFDTWIKETCDCPYRPTKLLGESNACVLAALDEFTMDVMLPSFRLPGIAETLQRAIDEEWPQSQIRAAAQEATEAALDDAVPAKEQLRRQGQMRRCFEKVGVL